MQKPLPFITDSELMLCEIRNHYWHLRALRPFEQAKRRKLYRKITKIKAVLIADGLDETLLRMWCRQFTRCHTEAAAVRFATYRAKNHPETKIFSKI